jgi:hypothetical protein
MPNSKDTPGKAHREYSQLLRLNERLLVQLQRIADDLEAPGTEALVREVRRRTGDLEQGVVDVTAAVEEAIRTVKVWESEIRLALTSEAGNIEVEGVPNLPATLARFIAERKQLPGFSYEVLQDDVRGWVIRWKEMTSAGTVRGCGQFYERPYAWLDE